MTKPRSNGRHGQRGQIIVIVALAMTAMLAMVALVVDGGNAYAQQRKTQNGVDASAEAGATQLARMMAGVAIADADVRTALDATAAANDIPAIADAFYTNKAGEMLDSSGVVTTDPATAEQVGSADGSAVIPPNTQGVKVGGSRDFSTYVGGVVGMSQWTASAEATAITGYAEESGFGGLVPLTFPILLTECEQSPPELLFPDDGIYVPYDPADPDTYNPEFGISWPFGEENRIAIPLCPNGPGNVGWIDWDGGGGGVAQLDRWIRGNEDNPPITTPRWYEVTETGDKTALDAPLDTLEGTDITIPIFHAEADDPGTTSVNEELIGTCDAEPADPKDDINDCDPADIGANGLGWYFLETFAVFHLEHSYIQGNFEPECNDPSLVSTATPYDPLNPGTGTHTCLIGYFKEKVIAKNMTVGSTTPTNAFTPLAIQLIH